jgi:hypothetical protein
MPGFFARLFLGIRMTCRSPARGIAWVDVSTLL